MQSLKSHYLMAMLSLKSQNIPKSQDNPIYSPYQPLYPYIALVIPHTNPYVPVRGVSACHLLCACVVT